MKELKPNTINWEQKCWRYFKLDRLIDALENGYMYFPSANEFEDGFEGATLITSDKIQNLIDETSSLYYINKAFKELKRLTKINCWHKADYENDLMWKIYSEDKKGVAITTTPEKMKDAFKPYKIKSEYADEDLYIGNVEYVDLSLKHINDTMLGIFYYKHIVFNSENEIRLSISLRMAEEFGVIVPEKGIFVMVDYTLLIDEIILGPHISADDRNRLMTTINKLGYGTKIKNSCLNYNPIFI